MDYKAEALETADVVITALKNVGHDYSSKRKEIADLFFNSLWEGNWDSTVFFDGDVADLRFIQEDEFDQHMDEDDQPEYEVFSAGHYVMFA